MKSATRSALFPYLTAIAASLLAMLVSLALAPVIEASHFSLFLAAVMFSAWNGGRGPGLLATVVGAYSISYFLGLRSLDFHLLDLLTPTPAVTTLAGTAEVLIFTLVAFLINSLNTRVRAARRRAEAARSEAEAATRRALFLAEATKQLVGSLDYETTLPTVARLAIPALASWCAVDVVETDGTVRRLAAAEAGGRSGPCPGPSLEAGHELEQGPSSSGRLCGDRPRLFPEINEAELRHAVREPDELDSVRRLGLGSYMCVPLRARGRTLGSLSFASNPARRRYGPVDLALAEELADRAAQAIENARLYRANETELARRAALLRVGRRFAAEGDLEQLLTELLEQAVAIVGGTDGLLARWDEARRVLVPVRDTVAPASEYGALRVGQAVSDRAVAARGPIVINGFPDESSGGSSGARAGILAAVAVPVMHEGHLLGTVSINSYDSAKRFTSEDAEVLELLASIGAAALVGLERARFEGVLLAARTAQHELNNRLALTMGHAELLSDDPELPASLRESANEALQGAKAAADIVYQLRQVTRVEETFWGEGGLTTLDLAASTGSAE